MKNEPIYSYSFGYAELFKEESEFEASKELNRKCRDFIEATIESGCVWQQAGLVVCSFNPEAAAKKVIVQFGLQRTALVVINTIVAKSYDLRICCENKEWAKKWPVFMDKAEDEDAPFYDPSYVIQRPHSCMFDAFASAVRRIHTSY